MAEGMDIAAEISSKLSIPTVIFLSLKIVPALFVVLQYQGSIPIRFITVQQLGFTKF